MRKFLTTVSCICSLIAFSSNVYSQDQDSGWVLEGDTNSCFGGSSPACSRVLWTFYTWPNILKELEIAMTGSAPGTREPDLNYPTDFLDAVAFPGGSFYPNPDDPDRPWGPIGPVVREGLILNAYLMEAFTNPQSARKEILNKSLFLPSAALDDLEMVRNALDQTMKALDKDIASLKKSGK